ncbi:MAG: tetratricopeptide repeat protein [Hyphomicrobiaceae bacterium]
MLRHSIATAICLALLVGQAAAVDTPVSTDAPDLAGPRAAIKAKNWPAAIKELTEIADKVNHADVYNLLGFALRKSGDYTRAATFYAKALDFDPKHKSALEYQGEMFVELNQLDKAKANLAKLEALCPKGCEELDDLKQAIEKRVMAPKPR